MRVFGMVIAISNGVLVLTLYVVAWGTPSPAIGLLEALLATTAGLATWFALAKQLRSAASK